MPGTIKGGMKAAATNKQRYGQDFYKVVGGAGGRSGKGKKGFAITGLAQEAGRKGGLASRRPSPTRNAEGKFIKEHNDESRNPQTTLWSRLLHKVRP